MAPLLSIIILVYNRREALAHTIERVQESLERLWHSQGNQSATIADGATDAGPELALNRTSGSNTRDELQPGSPPNSQDNPDLRPRASSGPASIIPPVFTIPPVWLTLAEIIIVDNASTDGSGDMVRQRFPHCRVVSMHSNSGVAGFNRAAEHASGTYVLILDDDAWPDGDSLTHALTFLGGEPAVAAVMLQPVHPRTGALEWPFDRVKALTRHWPDLRCANLIRREAWNAVGGYEERFFLYRNDTDLALKLLGAGFDIAYNPAWRAMHDSPHIAVRRVRWFSLSTRNWCWMCRRHARGSGGLMPLLMGWLWAHRLAGLSPARQWAAMRGGVAGVLGRPPSMAACVARDGRALRRLIALKQSLRR